MIATRMNAKCNQCFSALYLTPCVRPGLNRSHGTTVTRLNSWTEPEKTISGDTDARPSIWFMVTNRFSTDLLHRCMLCTAVYLKVACRLSLSSSRRIDMSITPCTTQTRCQYGISTKVGFQQESRFALFRPDSSQSPMQSEDSFVNDLEMSAYERKTNAEITNKTCLDNGISSVPTHGICSSRLHDKMSPFES
jgi:hypothetical protein